VSALALLELAVGIADNLFFKSTGKWGALISH
jgi:hypothetical protein